MYSQYFVVSVDFLELLPDSETCKKLNGEIDCL